MIPKIIKTEDQYEATLSRVDEIFDAIPGTPEGDELELLLLVIKDYEDRHYPVPVPDAIEVIKLKMMEAGLKAADIEPLIGKKSYVSKVMNRKKPLTADMMRALHKHLGIPADILLK